MVQIFHRSFNAISRLTIFGSIFVVTVITWVVATIYRSPWVSNAKVILDQPVPFSHNHHVDDDGIDCRYCHTSVEESSFAGMPSSKTCMNCHSQIWPDSAMLEPVRESFRNNKPIAWTRVNQVAGFAYFDHSIHVNKGIGCVSCHGPVNRMPLMWRDKTLYMEFCLECHRNPERFIRPREEVFNMAWRPPKNQLVEGARLVAYYKVQKLTDCYTCHR